MRILITGGAGYVGSLLTPTLLAQGHEVTVLDWFVYGDTLQDHPNLYKVHGKVSWYSADVFTRGRFDAVIHLACISNDPSFELNPALGAADFTATSDWVQLAKTAGARRFIYASSSSVYGAKPDNVEVTENLSLAPLTGYSQIKARCEEIVLGANGDVMTTAVLRPATVCGYAPRLRLDVVVNALTSQAYFQGRMTVQGGAQYRAHLHIQDMVRAYQAVLEAPAERIAGQVFNVAAENITILDLARRVQAVAGGTIDIATEAVDQRSYRLDTSKIARVLGFTPSLTVDKAIDDLLAVFDADAYGEARDPQRYMTNPIYYNVKQIQACHLS